MWKRIGLLGVVVVGCQQVAQNKPSATPKNAQPAVTHQSLALPGVSLPIEPAGAAAELVGSLPVQGEERFTAIATALWSTCGLLESGAVWCWGESHNSTSSDEMQAVRQVPLSHVTKLVGAGERFLALASGALYLWGRQPRRLDGSSSSLMPIALPLGSVLDVATTWGGFYTLEQSGRIAYWNADGESFEITTLPAAQSLAASTTMVCARLASGQVSCLNLDDARPAVAPALSNVVELVAGGSQHCARQRDGNVSCWPEAAPPELASGAIRLSATPHAICAFKSRGLPACQPLTSGGDRDESVYMPAQLFPSASVLTDVSVGPQHGCAVVNGRAWCWGDGSFGALGPAGAAWHLKQFSKPLGNGTFTNEQVLVRISLGDTASLHQVADIAVGRSHQCIITLEGSLRCWGNNDWGQLGVDPMKPAFGIVPATELKGVDQITVNSNASCATVAGDLFCWGRQPWRTDLALCRAESSEAAPCSAKPARLATGVEQAVLGGNFGCLLDRNHLVSCWGANDLGQLGNGTTTPSATPVRVLTEDGKPLGSVAQLRVFAGHACAVGGTGKLWCWGDNAPMAQGRHYNSPPRITHATGFPKLPAVRDVSDRCVLGSGGELRCWGDVFEDRRFSYEPVQVGHCGVEQLASGPGRCFADAAGVSCLDWPVLEDDGWQSAVFRLPHAAKQTSGSDSQICALDAQSRVACFRYESFSLLPVVGESIAELLLQDATTPGCTRDAAPTKLPSFPPVPPASVTISAVLNRLSAAPQTPPVSKKLSPNQVARLLRLLNDPRNYTNMATCHDPLFEFTLRDARGESQGLVNVGSCGTLEVSPDLPAKRGKGNIIEAPLSDGLRQICREMGLEACASPD